MLDEVAVSSEKRIELINMCDNIMVEIVSKGESAEMRVRLANIHLRLGEREEAIMCLQTALRLRPDTPAILAKLKQICTDQEFASLEMPEKIEPFWNDISGLLRYPLCGSGVYLLIGGTVFVTVLQYILSLPTIFFYGSLVLALFLSGYLCSYFISVMRSSARGKDTPPDWPDITDIMGNIFGSLFTIGFPGFVSFFPVIVYSVIMFIYHTPGYILPLLAIFGMLYYPMALIASAITGAPLNSANFVGIINSIRKVRKDYFIAVGILILFSIISFVAYILVSMTTQAMAGGFVSGFAVQFVNLYFMMIFAHILGLLYRQCESRIIS